jgi:hypothetical protein
MNIANFHNNMARLQRLLTPNCHEAWVHQLGYLGYEIDIIDGLPGRYCNQWDNRMRPVPKAGVLTTLDKVLQLRPSYDCIVVHNITDLLDLKTLPGPRLLVIHETLDSRIRQHGLSMLPDQLRLLTQHYLDLVGGHIVAISALKAKAWGFIDDIVENCVDVHEYLPWSGTVASGLRVSNQITARKEVLLWDFHEAAFKGVPVRLVGFNPDMPGVNPSKNWDDLKSILSSHRFFIHTAHPELEDGYNSATLEAMAAGLPILGNRNPSSPVEHGVSGFLSDEPEELRHYARLLLQDKDLAGRMGEAARKTVKEHFSVERFVARFRRSIERAQEKWGTRRLSDAYFSPVLFEENGKLELLARSGYFLRLSDRFEDCVRSMEIEEAVSVLDEIMKSLGMPRDICISGFEDLTRITVDVSNHLKELHENRAAGTLLKATAILGSLTPFLDRQKFQL